MFSDRLVDNTDHESFIALLSDKLGTLFDLTYHNLCPNKQPPIFGKPPISPSPARLPRATVHYTQCLWWELKRARPTFHSTPSWIEKRVHVVVMVALCPRALDAGGVLFTRGALVLSLQGIS